jgi:hypothetical protein
MRFFAVFRQTMNASSTVYPAVQIDKSILQSGFELVPCHAVY